MKSAGFVSISEEEPRLVTEMKPYWLLICQVPFCRQTLLIFHGGKKKKMGEVGGKPEQKPALPTAGGGADTNHRENVKCSNKRHGRLWYGPKCETLHRAAGGFMLRLNPAVLCTGTIVLSECNTSTHNLRPSCPGQRQPTAPLSGGTATESRCQDVRS